MRWPWQKRETRAAGAGFTNEVMQLREAYIAGRTGIGELTATVQTCVSLWENGLSLADVDGTEMLTPAALAMMARSLALRGEAVFLIREDGLVPCSDWDLRTRNGRPVAYRISIPEVGGGLTMTALAGEVLHVRIGTDMAAPWLGSPPLRRASLTAELLNEVERSLAEVYALAPLGSQIVPFPESASLSLDGLGQSFRGRRGRVMVRESVNVAAAGGPTPNADWRPINTSPDIRPAMPAEALAAARDAISGVFGVLPAILGPDTTGPMVREGQRHLAQWQLQPIAALIAEETSEKLGAAVSLDVMRPLQAFDASGRARAMATILEALARANEASIDPAGIASLFNWKSSEFPSRLDPGSADR